MRWDIFCRVIDNYGDMGVCWRLCADLAARNQQVRLWVDDARPLAWMAPHGCPGVQVLDWGQASVPSVLADLTPAEVWVEAFGCELPAAFVQARMGQTPPVWINLEYLSAQSYVERAHGLPSPILQGPGQGWTKYFYYPGFTPRTGGLLRESTLAARQAGFASSTWLQTLGIARRPQELLLALFCYEPGVLLQWLSVLAQAPTPTHLLVTAGRTAAAFQTAWSAHDRAAPGWNAAGQLRATELPFLTQAEFDQLLWATDLNFVRGEDSLVRALWAGKSLVWQIYPQADGVHLDKLDAFLDLLDADPALRAFHRHWNADAQGAAAVSVAALAACWTPLPWQAGVRNLRAAMLGQADLGTQLLEFAAKKR